MLGQSDGGPGTWVESPSRSKGQAYQEQISGVPRGIEYDVDGTLFDGYDAGRKALLDAKDWQSYPPLDEDFWRDGALKEARDQITAANGTAIEWHFSTQAAANVVAALFAATGITGITIVVTPKI